MIILMKKQFESKGSLFMYSSALLSSKKMESQHSNSKYYFFL